MESGALRSGNSFQTLAGSEDPGKAEQPGLAQTRSSSRMGISQDFQVVLVGDPREATPSPWNHGSHPLVSEHPRLIFYSMFLNLYCARDPLRVLCSLK